MPWPAPPASCLAAAAPGIVAVMGIGGWASDVAVVVRRGWRAIAAVLLVTMMLPLLPLSGVIADGAALGQARAGWGHSFGPALDAVLAAPVVLALGIGCGLVVARGWTGAVWAAASAGAGRRPGLRDALAWSWLMTPASPEAASASLSAPAAALIASLVALPGTVLLVAESSVSHARLKRRVGTRT